MTPDSHGKGHLPVSEPMLLGANVCDGWLPSSDSGGNHVYKAGERIEALPDEWFAIFRDLGIQFLQIDREFANTWERSPGKWDWLEYEYFFRKTARNGFRTIFFPHFHFPPAWFEQTDEFTGVRCLKHDRYLPCFSLWSPHILPYLERCVKNFKKFGAGKKMEQQAIYLGTYGDFGEAMFPAGNPWLGREVLKHDRGLEDGHTHIDFWCNDDYAKKSFRDFLKNKYGRISDLNRAYGSRFKAFGRIEYPVSPAKAGRRRWLDFVHWYYLSMSEFCGQVARIYRKHFPKTLMMLPLGGGVELPQLGQDNTALPKIMAHHGVHIRSTLSGVAQLDVGLSENLKTVGERFAKTYLILKIVATACKFYGARLWLEPAYPPGMSADAIKCRIFESVSCGACGYYDWSWTFYKNREVYTKHRRYLTVEKPVVEIATLFPTTWHRLHPGKWYPESWEQGCFNIRKFFDYDVLDERLIEDGALAGYRVLIIFAENILEEATLKKLSDWVDKGGILLTHGTGVIRTVEGDAQYHRHLFDSRSTGGNVGKVWRAIRNQFGGKVAVSGIGAGYTVFLNQGRNGVRDFYRLCTTVVNRLIYPYTEAAFRNRAAKDVFVTVFEGKAGFLNLTHRALKRKVDGQGIIVPPFSMRFVKFAGNNQSTRRV